MADPQGKRIALIRDRGRTGHNPIYGNQIEIEVFCLDLQQGHDGKGAGNFANEPRIDLIACSYRDIGTLESRLELFSEARNLRGKIGDL